MARGLGAEQSLAYLADDFDIGSSRSVIRGNCIDNANDVALHHPNVVWLTLFACLVKEMLNEIHDVGSSVHICLSVILATVLDTSLAT